MQQMGITCNFCPPRIELRSISATVHDPRLRHRDTLLTSLVAHWASERLGITRAASGSPAEFRHGDGPGPQTHPLQARPEPLEITTVQPGRLEDHKSSATAPSAAPPTADFPQRQTVSAPLMLRCQTRSSNSSVSIRPSASSASPLAPAFWDRPASGKARSPPADQGQRHEIGSVCHGIARLFQNVSQFKHIQTWQLITPSARRSPSSSICSVTP